MPLIINTRASRVTLCQVPFRSKSDDGEEHVSNRELIVLPAEQVKVDNGFRIEPSKTRVTAEQMDVIRKHRPSRKLFEAGVLKWDDEAKGNNGGGKKAA